MTSTQPNRSAENGKRATCDYVAISSAIASLRYCAAVSSLQSGTANASGADSGSRLATSAPILSSTDVAADRSSDGP